MRTIYRCSFLVGIAVLIIVGISGCQPVEIPPVFVPTSTTLATVTLRPTPTPTATETPTPTLVEFSTELPTSVAGCNVEPDDPEAYKIWAAQRNAAEKAWLATKTEADFGSSFTRELIEGDDPSLPYNTVSLSFDGGRMAGCSTSADRKRVVFDFATSTKGFMHLEMSPSATAAFQAAGVTDIERFGYNTDLDGMLAAISQGNVLEMKVRMFENQSGKPRERLEKMEGWEWARDLLRVPLDPGVIGATGPWYNVGTWIAKFVMAYSEYDAEWQGKTLAVAETVNVPVAELGWAVRQE